MKGATFCNLMAAVAAAAAGAAVAVAIAAFPGNDGFSVACLGWLAGGAAIGVMTAAALIYRMHRAYQPLARYLTELGRIDARNTAGAAVELPRLPVGHPLSATTQAVNEALASVYERVQFLEQASAAKDVRCRRAVQETERIRGVLAGLAEPIVAIDQYDELVMANRSARELFQIGADSPERRAIAQVVRCEKLIELLTATSHRRVSGSRVEELELVGPDGSPRWYRANAMKLSVNGGDGDQGAVAVLRDITDRKALQKRNAEFVSSVSHEMKTPLAGIKAYVELLADGEAEDDATREEFLGVINGQTDRLQRLIDNLLNLARIEAGVVQVQKQPRPLNEILEEALRVVRPSAEAKQIALSADLSPLYLGVLADRDMLLQAAINLLSNAIKYTRAGGQVTLRSRMADDEVRFEVQDTGVGLSEEDCDRVFEKFYRVKKDKDMAAGTGLGLPLAKHIVEDVHGGRISVTSQLGVGSTFAVVLPNAGQRVNPA